MRLHFTLIGKVSVTLLAVSMLLTMSATLVESSSYHLDHDSVQTDTSTVSGGTYRLDAGLAPLPSVLTADSMPGSHSSASSESSHESSAATEDSEEHGGRRGNTPVTDRGAPERGPANPLEPGAPEVPATPPSIPSKNEETVTPTIKTRLPERGSSGPVHPSEPLVPPTPPSLPSENEETKTVPAIAKDIAIPAAEPTTHPAAPTTPEQNTEFPKPTPLSPVESAAALGSVTVAEAGILARLAWIARIKSLYGVIPAFLS